ncbi:peptidase S8 [Enemella evansiae]|uniref:S8 family peptidase n=1 Tax=Enemella evansiae TaxID=2016499 RepID=UPI000B973625|nr:S8 family serine peptidase [Enemella evansiae]OYO16499.1 peptidase S8 [Enemella evansiae]
MQIRTLRRGALACVAAVALVLPAVPAAMAAPQAEPPSTPVPFTPVEGEINSYVVNVNGANPGKTKQAEKAVVESGGKVVQSWPQIGVVIAHSTKADFLTKIRATKKNVVESAGPSRTAPVTEGTPGTSGFRSKGASGYKKKPQFPNGDERGTTTPATAQDPGESQQWNNQMIKSDQANKITDGSRNVLVGVLDSGIDYDHPDLRQNIDVGNSVSCVGAGQPNTGRIDNKYAWEDTTSYHGTHVAGTIAAARNGQGIVGVAPNVRMASVKVVNDDGFIYPEYAICGFVWAGDKNMDVTNNSYFVDPFEFWCGDQANQAPAMEAVRRSVAYATGKGVVHAAAAGNSSYDLANKTTDEGSPNDSTAVPRQINSSCKDIPTELDGVVTVSSVDQARQKSGFSNYGYGVIDVSAPGSAILSTMPTDHPTAPNYAKLSGTSMASPHVAGVLALMKSANPNATPAQLISMLKAQAQDTPCPTTYTVDPRYPQDQKCTGTAAYNSFYGDGIVDALKAVQPRS